MERRDFLKMAGLAGVSLVSPLGIRSARAQEGPYEGKLFIMLNAGGGWDPTSLCDPKGRLGEMDMEPMNNYLRDDIGTAGNISYAPVPGHQEFFDKYYDELTVINGVDTQTNGHDSGSRHTWSGRLAEGYPSFSALVAGSVAATKPLAFISNGGYDLTQGLVAPTRTGSTGALSRIAYPNRPDPGDAERAYHLEGATTKIQELQRQRLQDRMGKQGLPNRRHAMNQLFLATQGKNEIRRLTEFLPELDNSNNRLFRQAQLAIAAYKAGVTASANLSMGGFDTHGNHDQNHFPRLGQLLAGVDFIMTEAERQGVRDKVVVMVGSDFGRTPGYNGNQGKDHWSITSVMLLGAGIPGDRVIGSTTHEHRPINVNPTTLAPDEDGIRIEPRHIHLALRELAGIQESEASRAFPITAERLPLLDA